jgi:integrase
MVTGMRAGDRGAGDSPRLIEGLRTQDIGYGYKCLYVRHSWNCEEGLKTPKNNEERTVELGFEELLISLSRLVKRHPHGGDALGHYVVWTDKMADKPIDQDIFLDGLRDADKKTTSLSFFYLEFCRQNSTRIIHRLPWRGMSETEAKTYHFHSWRHFFTAYMREEVNEKLLQKQTGHKTLAMIKHYSDHSIAGERERIQAAQRLAFGRLLPMGGEAAAYVVVANEGAA